MDAMSIREFNEFGDPLVWSIPVGKFTKFGRNKVPGHFVSLFDSGQNLSSLKSSNPF